MKYVTVIDEQSYEIEIDNDGAILVNGELRDVDFLNLGGSLYSIITGNKSLEAVIDDDEGKIAVMMGGQLFETQVLDERAMLLMQRRGGLKITSGEVSAPMPGLIVIVTVEVGQAVAQGDTVVILESMKMQNELKSPVAGVVRAIHVEASQAVDKGQMLVEIGPPPDENN
ncbi:MAG: biotin/lipoyl-binding protein [Chloroflexota bacterium]|nr:biotin/lipoyl-binding protein [Chloroflexota bacterium]MDE2858025.1 biotin/lipoyl-binding protein [Chloroflexota bacterium]MDE2950528.1 biotin/lipoyl-binding protein [Chloroflexota bacterium]